MASSRCQIVSSAAVDDTRFRDRDRRSRRRRSGDGKNHRLGRDLRRPKFWNAQARPGRPALGGILHGRSGQADQACPAWLPSIVRAEDLARLSRVGAECARCRLFPGDRRPDRDIGLIRRWRPMTQRCPGQAPPQLLSRSLARRIDPPTPPRN